MRNALHGGPFYPLGATTRFPRPGPELRHNSKTSLQPALLDRPVAGLRGVGRDTERRLGQLGIRTIRDLLLHLPFRHESATDLFTIASLPEREEVNLKVRVVSCAVHETARRRIKVLEALVRDDTGSMVAVWYNQAYLETAFREQPEVLLRGMLVRKRQRGPLFVVRRHEILGREGESRHILGLIPVYPSTGDLSVRTIRNLLHTAAPLARHFPEPLPAELLARRGYPRKAEAILACHFPSFTGEAQTARERLAFEELLLLQLALVARRRQLDREQTALPLGPPGELAASFLAGLPYQPTAAQQRVMGEIDADLRRPVPMRRLLHGDVGSGKTLVAAYALVRAAEEGGQAALMAPTEVLADQHFLGLSERLARHGIRVGLLKGSLPAGERRAMRSSTAKGQVDIVIGTHALIQEGVRFHDLRLVVVDEQHRFGVRQREAILLTRPDGRKPHTLHMSATPIPRTLSLTLYGDLDVSVLDEMPPGRQPVKTRLVFPRAERRMWEFVRGELTKGRQAYVVCPLIEESEALQAASANETFRRLSAGELKGFRVGLLHGQLPAAEKAAVMSAFAAGQLEVLISTSVIEVGIDVANATVMVILGARRFGLSQLHQLRGRVGRGAHESYCLLAVEEEDPTVADRLALFARTADGFVLAEADLALRGAGQLFGERQSGAGDLLAASLVRDRSLLEEARAEAERLLALCEEGEVSSVEAVSNRESPTVQVWLPALEAARTRFGDLVSKMERV